MRISDIIRGILDIIDNAEAGNETPKAVEGGAYQEDDIKRFKQIVDLAGQDTLDGYANQPNEQYASIDAVTVDAGADGMNGTKDPADIRGSTQAIYPGTAYGAR